MKDSAFLCLSGCISVAPPAVILGVTGGSTGSPLPICPDVVIQVLVVTFVDSQFWKHLLELSPYLLKARTIVWIGAPGGPYHLVIPRIGCDYDTENTLVLRVKTGCNA